MSDIEVVRRVARGALAALEASRRRIDDLNVYPVPDGDTGTNLTLTARGVVEQLERGGAGTRADLADAVTRAALMAARGNSGVILSQIVRGVAAAVADAAEVTPPVVARALRGGSDAAYAAVREPVEGTMLTVIREVAEAAERRAPEAVNTAQLLVDLIPEAERSLAGTTQLLAVLRDAGVVDAGGAGVVEILRGVAAVAAGVPLPEPPAGEELPETAVHQELSRFRYCTTFVVTGDGLDAADLERELERLGDSLLVVGDPRALKVHVHTDDPGAPLSLACARGALAAVEVADMHAQTVAREARLSHDGAVAEPKTCEAIAVVAGDGIRRLFQSLGAGGFVEGGQTMNPATSELVSAIEAADAPEVILLPNNANVVLSAEQAATLAEKRARVVPTKSIQAGLAAMVVYDGTRGADANADEMATAAADVASAAVTIATRDATVDGVGVRAGEYLGLVEDGAVAAGTAFDEVARAVVERLLAEPRDVLTLLTGAGAPSVNGLREALAARHPELEIELHEGGQPHYLLLIGAE